MTVEQRTPPLTRADLDGIRGRHARTVSECDGLTQEEPLLAALDEALQLLGGWRRAFARTDGDFLEGQDDATAEFLRRIGGEP